MHALQDTHSTLVTCHIFAVSMITAAHGKFEVSDVKDCLTALQTEYEKVSLPEDVPEDSPER